MIGISSYGCYLPRYRLRRDELAEIHGIHSLGGERTVANFDEDTLTMAYQACFNCMLPEARNRLGGLYFASTSSPFNEKMASPVISAALNFPPNVQTIDFSGSLRSGANALVSAFHGVQARSESQILVVASEKRMAEP